LLSFSITADAPRPSRRRAAFWWRLRGPCDARQGTLDLVTHPRCRYATSPVSARRTS